MLLQKKQLNIVEKILTIAVLAFCFNVLTPHLALADEFKEPYAQGPAVFVLKNFENENSRINYNLPDNLNIGPKMVRYVTITAYSSTQDQTDSTPFITANGSYVHDGIVAANFLSFGTKIKIPELFGDKIFSIEDRMNVKYNSRIDIWMTTRESAKNFGVKYAKIEVY